MRRVTPASIPVDAATASGVNDRRAEATRVDQPLREEDVHHREQKRRVTPRPDEEVLVGHPCGLGPARVHDHHLASPLLDRAHAALDVGRGHEAALRHDGIATETQEVIGAVDIGDGKDRTLSVEGPRHDELWEVIHRRAREEAGGTQRTHEESVVEHRADVEARGVADVDADRVGAVLFLQTQQAVGREVDRLLPADLLPAVGRPPQRLLDPI